MTVEQVKRFEGRVARVRIKEPDYGGGIEVEGRVEVVDDETIRVVGQPKRSGIALGDAPPISVLIAQIVEITPLP